MSYNLNILHEKMLCEVYALEFLDSMIEFYDELCFLVYEKWHVDEAHSPVPMAYSIENFYLRVINNDLSFKNLTFVIKAVPECSIDDLYLLILKSFSENSWEFLQDPYFGKFEEVIALLPHVTRSVARYALWDFIDTLAVKPIIVIEQGEYLTISAIKEIRDLHNRVGLHFLIVSDRDTTRETILEAEGEARFFDLAWQGKFSDVEKLYSGLTALHSDNIVDFHSRDSLQSATSLKQRQADDAYDAYLEDQRE